MALLSPQSRPQLQCVASTRLILLTGVAPHIYCGLYKTRNQETYRGRVLALPAPRHSISTILPMVICPEHASAQRRTIHVPRLPFTLLQRCHYSLLDAGLARRLFDQSCVTIRGMSFSQYM